MCGIPAKKSRDRLDNGLLIDVPGIPLGLMTEPETRKASAESQLRPIYGPPLLSSELRL